MTRKELLERIKRYSPKNVKHKQYVWAFCLAIVFFVILISKDLFDSPKVKPVAKQLKKVDLSGVGYDLKGEAYWKAHSDDELASLKSAVAAQNKDKDRLQKQITSLEKIVNVYQSAKGEKGDSSYSTQLDSLRSDVAMLKEMLAHKRTNESVKISSIELELEGKKSKKKGRSIENYLPAMSYVKATVVSGVDASVGINATSDPRPALFRVEGKAINAMYEDKAQLVDLRGCMVLGSARGDLSSERVFVRLEKMSCSFSDGIIHEMKVNGYATGVGKAGIRGKVVSREGDLITKGFLAGVVSGVGGGMADRYKNPSSVLGIGQQPETKDILRSGVGSGLQNSTDRISDYMIKRAEQYQPVIMLPAGSETELVFTDGVYLDGGKDK